MSARHRVDRPCGLATASPAWREALSAVLTALVVLNRLDGRGGASYGQPHGVTRRSCDARPEDVGLFLSKAAANLAHLRLAGWEHSAVTF